MSLTLDFPPLVWILLVLAAGAALLALRLLKPFRSTAATTVHLPPNGKGPAAEPAVTVVVYASTHGEELDAYLRTLMEQDLEDFETVLVYDAGASATAAVSEHYAGLYPGLRFTFIPPGSHNLSRRKLAITLGMKAARSEVVVITTSDCRITSPSWLRLMTAPFADNAGVGVVLGYSRFDASELPAASRLYRQFDAVRTAAQWLGYAIDGQPYRGDGFNLAFRRNLFFDQKGFAKTINLETGDDDLFVNDITDAANTAVVLDTDAILTVSWGRATSRMWTDRKERHDFTARWLPRRPFVQGGAVSALQWAVAGCCGGAVALGCPSVWPLAGAGTVLLAFWTAETLVYRRAARHLESASLWLSVPLFWLWHPVGNFLFRFRHRKDRKKNYTWQRRKRHRR